MQHPTLIFWLRIYMIKVSLIGWQSINCTIILSLYLKFGWKTMMEYVLSMCLVSMMRLAFVLSLLKAVRIEQMHLWYRAILNWKNWCLYWQNIRVKEWWTVFCLMKRIKNEYFHTMIWRLPAVITSLCHGTHVPGMALYGLKGEVFCYVWLQMSISLPAVAWYLNLRNRGKIKWKVHRHWARMVLPVWAERHQKRKIAGKVVWEPVSVL